MRSNLQQLRNWNAETSELSLGEGRSSFRVVHFGWRLPYSVYCGELLALKPSLSATFPCQFDWRLLKEPIRERSQRCAWFIARFSQTIAAYELLSQGLPTTQIRQEAAVLNLTDVSSLKLSKSGAASGPINASPRPYLDTGKTQ